MGRRVKGNSKQAYRADGGDIGVGRLKEIADNAYGDEEKCRLAQRVLVLLDELEKEKGYASTYETEKWHYHGLAESEGERADRAEKALEAADKRIAELENDDVHQRLANAQHQLNMAELTIHNLKISRQTQFRKLKAAEKRTAELSKAASVSSQWKPDVCPITGRKFFMWIDHPTLGYVPTYGGPFDSYTIPARDSDGEFSCERYDHDLGNWREGECVGLYLIDDDELCRVYKLEQRIAELESRAVNLPKRSIGEVMHMSGFSREYAEGWCAGNDNARHEIRAAGVKIKEE
jgi:hypothetical protein